ncbi:MAG: tetratricopeptide repeat protein [Ginsengibacter sp.]
MAQKPVSLLKELNNYKKEDTIRLNLLQSVARLYENEDPGRTLKICDAMIVLAQKLNRPGDLAYSYALRGKILSALRQYTAAIAACEKSIEIAGLADNKRVLSMGYGNLGKAFFGSADYSKSLEFCQKALVINEQLGNDWEIAVNANTIGADYEALSDYPKALEYYQKSQGLTEKVGNKNHLAGVLLNTGLVYYRLVNYPRALEYYQKALALDEELKNKSGIASDLTFIGGLYGELSDNKKALEYLQKSLILGEQLDDKVLISNALENIAACYSGLSDYPKALEYYQKAVKISTELGNKDGIATNLGEIGIIYAQLADYKKALQYLNKSLAFNMETGNKRAASENLTNIGTIHQDLSEYPIAIDYFQKALRINNELGINDAVNLNSLGNAYIDLFEYDKALGYFQKSLAISEESGNAKISAENYCGIGIVYSNVRDSIHSRITEPEGIRYAKAVNYLMQGLDTGMKYGIIELQRSAWENLSIVYESQKDYAKSMAAYKHFIVARDSMVNDIKKKEITRLEFQYEFDKKKDSLRLQQGVTDIKLREQIMLAGQQRQQLALNQKELALINKEKDLQKIAYLKGQADLQNEQLEKKGKEKQLTISQKEKELQQANVKTLTQEKHLSVLKLQQQWIYIIGGLILLGLILFYFFYRTRLQQVRLKTEMAAARIEQQQKEMDFQRQLGDISLSALRSQMNPHFIFNCLNSIKLYTTQNDTVAASEYLTKFSRLIRLVLENSRNERTTLSAELDALRLYMEMEAMRFKEKLKYTISIGKDVDMDYIEIPPLLLQPYVENAIWHGLMQKEHGGNIDIAVNMQPGESILVINITDDGIGRVKSAELMSKTATKHKSYGMKVTSERIALINQIYKTGANVSIHDLVDNDGHPSGTQVTIQIPV